jgi:hypothetical protein
MDWLTKLLADLFKPQQPSTTTSVRPDPVPDYTIPDRNPAGAPTSIPIPTALQWNPDPVAVESDASKAARERAAGFAPISQNYFNTYTQRGADWVTEAIKGAEMMATLMKPGQVDPNAYMESWKGAQGDLFNTAFNATSPYAQAMNQVAQRQASLGSEAALAAMPGARNSGAGMAAFGQAYADPFAQAQVAQQQLATGLYGDLSGRSMEQYARNHLTNADFQHQANTNNAGWQNQADLQNAGWSQQAALANQAMSEAYAQRQLTAGSMFGQNALGWGNIEAGLASDLNYIYEPMGLYDYLKDIGAIAAQAASGAYRPTNSNTTIR